MVEKPRSCLRMQASKLAVGPQGEHSGFRSDLIMESVHVHMVTVPNLHVHLSFVPRWRLRQPSLRPVRRQHEAQAVAAGCAIGQSWDL